MATPSEEVRTMPIYEYRCYCGATAEVLAALGAPAPACQACGAETRKAVSRFASDRASRRGPIAVRDASDLEGHLRRQPRVHHHAPATVGATPPSRGPLPGVGRRSPSDRGPRGSLLGGPATRRRTRRPRRRPVIPEAGADASGQGIVGGGHHAHPHPHSTTHPQMPHPPAA